MPTEARSLATILQVVRDGRNFPGAVFADVFSGREEIGEHAGVELFLAFDTGGQELFTARAEFADELFDEVQRVRAEDVLSRLRDG